MAEFSPVKAAKKRKARPKKSGRAVSELILEVVAASKEKKGVSLAAMKKALAAGGYDVDKNKSRVKTAVKSLLAKGNLIQTKGSGASGSFKLATAKKRVRRKSTKSAKKVKKPRAKKSAAAKKKKSSVRKSPKKAKKPAKKAAAKKSPRKSPKKSPRKSPKKSPRKSPKRKPAAKRPRAGRKSPARKATKRAARRR